MDAKVTSQWTKSIQISRQSRLTGVKVLKKIFFVLEDFTFFNVSRPLCTQGVLMYAKLSNTWHVATGKGHHITGYTLCIEDTSLLRTI